MIFLRRTEEIQRQPRRTGSLVRIYLPEEYVFALFQLTVFYCSLFLPPLNRITSAFLIYNV
nr:MAG TPA_asm: hypothetical protein [Caudoviricetes sp.]